MQCILTEALPQRNCLPGNPALVCLSYLNNPGYDIKNSYVIGDRITDVQLAKNLGCKAIWLNNDPNLGASEINDEAKLLSEHVALETPSWEEVYRFLKLGLRSVNHRRKTSETDISISLNIDGNGQSKIHTGIGFFDHMLDQVARHGRMDLEIRTAKGDLQIDEHHTIEDIAIALGEAFATALSDKKGMSDMGFVLPMDDAVRRLLIDFGGRTGLYGILQFTERKNRGNAYRNVFSFFQVI